MNGDPESIKLAQEAVEKELGRPAELVSKHDVGNVIAEKWLTTAQAAKILGIGPDTVMYHARLGRMKFVQLDYRECFEFRTSAYTFLLPRSVEDFAKLPRAPGPKQKVNL